MTHRAVIFDCDGTLVDSERLGTEVLVDVAREHGARFSPSATLLDDLHAALRGLSMAQCLAELEQRGGFTYPPDIEPAIRARTAVVFQTKLRAIPGAPAFVRRLQVPFCVASSGPRAKIELSLGLTGLLSHFEGRIFSSYEIGSWKPEPDLFLHAAQSLGVAPTHCAVIEDSQPGVDAGVAAGMFVYALGDAPLVLPDGARARRVASYLELERVFPS